MDLIEDASALICASPEQQCFSTASLFLSILPLFPGYVNRITVCFSIFLTEFEIFDVQSCILIKFQFLVPAPLPSSASAGREPRGANWWKPRYSRIFRRVAQFFYMRKSFSKSMRKSANFSKRKRTVSKRIRSVLAILQEKCRIRGTFAVHPFSPPFRAIFIRFAIRFCYASFFWYITEWLKTAVFTAFSR